MILHPVSCILCLTFPEGHPMDWMHEFPGDYLLHLASFRVLARFAGRQGAYADAATELGSTRASCGAG